MLMMMVFPERNNRYGGEEEFYVEVRESGEEKQANKTTETTEQVRVEDLSDTSKVQLIYSMFIC